MHNFGELQTKVNALAFQYEREIEMFSKCQITHADLMFTNKQYEQALDSLADAEYKINQGE